MSTHSRDEPTIMELAFLKAQERAKAKPQHKAAIRKLERFAFWSVGTSV